MAEMSFNGRSTLSYYELDLVTCILSPAVRKRSLVSILGADGNLDYMKGLGEPTYESRTLRAEFTIVGSNPLDVLARLNNEIEGETVRIVLPDDSTRCMIGDAHITQFVAKPGGSVVITASCQPWRLRTSPVEHSIPASSAPKTYTWYNSGKRTAVPEITVPAADVTIQIGDTSKTLTAGTYLLPDLSIPGKSSISITISGGAMTAEYQEAIL